MTARGRHGRDERGVALLMVLWIFAVLTSLVGEFSRRMRDDAIAAQNVAEEAQAQGVAMAGLNQALYRMLLASEHKKEDDNIDDDEEEEQWLPDGAWHQGAYGGGTYAVRIVDEGGKIPLNRADDPLLRRVFGNLGLDSDAQEEMVDAILDWRDADSLHRLHGAEDEYYRGLPQPYRAKNGPFDSVDELLLVRGMTRELLLGVPAEDRDGPPPVSLRDVFSVFNRTANINVRNAPEPVLQVLLASGERASRDDVEEDVEEVISTRGGDAAGALKLMRAKVGDPIARRLVDRSAHTLAIDVRAVMEKGHVQARLGAVVDLAEDGDGFHVVRWFDRLPLV